MAEIKEERTFEVTDKGIKKTGKDEILFSFEQYEIASQIAEREGIPVRKVLSQWRNSSQEVVSAA